MPCRSTSALAAAALLVAVAPARAQIEPFAPGVVATEAHDELAATLSPDGRRLVFVRRAEGGPFTLHEAHRTPDGWTEPNPLPFSGTHPDQEPAFSPDGTRLFFQSRRPMDPSGAIPPDAPRDDDLWVVDVRPEGWGEPRPVPPPVHRAPPDDGGLPFQGREMAPSIDAEGNLFYWSAIPGKLEGESDLYRARPGGDGWTEPENLGPPVDSPHYETHPWIAPDGSYLLFTCDGCPDAIGASDVYVSRRGEAGWSPPVNLGPAVNSEAYDFAASISPDGRRLLVSSNRGRDGGEPGRQDIYWIEVDRVPALGFLRCGGNRNGE